MMRHMTNVWVFVAVLGFGIAAIGTALGGLVLPVLYGFLFGFWLAVAVSRSVR